MKRIYEYEDLQPVLERLLQDRESGDMEFKSAKGGFPHSMWETYSSFANTDGGAIVFGVKEKDEQFFLDGLTEAQVRRYQKFFFSYMQLLTLALAYSEEEITNERLQYALGMHRALSKMCAKKMLESAGYGRGKKYHVYGVNVALPDGNVALPDGNVALPDANVGLQRKRYSKNELRDILVSFCTQWKTAEEIALYVGRNLVYIRNRVLPNLSDVIEKMYDLPHHPRQKYRAKQHKESEE